MTDWQAVAHVMWTLTGLSPERFDEEVAKHTTSGPAPRVPLAAGPLADAPLGVASLDREGACDDPQGEPLPPVTRSEGEA